MRIIPPNYDPNKSFGNPTLVPALPPKPAGPKLTIPPVGWTGVGHGKLQLNDLLFDLPPEQIQITQRYQNLELPLLRTKENSVLKSGHGEFFLSFPLLFTEQPGKPAWRVINEQLAPLVQQFRKTPFCVIENELVRKTIFPGTYDDKQGRRKELANNIAFSLVNMAVSTVEGLPGSLLAHFNLIYFNYFPYSEKFTFLRHWSSKDAPAALSSKEEAASAIRNYQQGGIEVYNPQESAAWKAFWQHGWNRNRRLLTTSLSNSFALEFTFLDNQEGSSSYQVVWQAVEMIPVHLAVSFENRIAKLPVLNWVYATHQYVGGMNRTFTAVFQTESSKRQELERLQYLIHREQEQTARFRYLSQYWGIKITNDLARLCGIDCVVAESLDIDTIPGHPNLLQVTLVLKEHHLRSEGLQPLTHIPRMDGVLQQTLDRLIKLGKELGLVESYTSPLYEVVGPKDEHGSLLNPGHESYDKSGEVILWRGPGHKDANIEGNVDSKDPIVIAFYQRGGPYDDNLIELLNRRPNITSAALPALPGNDTASNPKELEYYNRLRSLLEAILQGPLKQDQRFDDLRQAAFNIQGNYQGNICFPDLDLPPHPATGRIIDTEPDCYFYNLSDSQPIRLEKAFSKGLEIISNAFASAKVVCQGSGGLGFDEQATPTLTPSGTSPKPLKPSQVGQSGRYDDIILQAAMYKPGVDSNLIKAIIAAESSGNPDAVSPKGAQGLMQIMPSTAAELAAQLSRDFNEPVTAAMVAQDPFWNIMAGTLYMDRLLKQFGSPELALAAYNAGPGRVQQAGNQIPNISETKNFVATVMANYQKLSSSKPASSEATFLMPVSGAVTSDFYDPRDGGARLHSGIDIAAPAGTPIIAPTDLTITQVGNSSSYGYYIYAKDAYGNTHMFGHLQEMPNLTVGQKVSQGDFLGKVGNTGTSTGPHLDWKVKGPDGQYVDIGKLLNLSKGQSVKSNSSSQITLGPTGLPGTGAVMVSAGERGFDGWDHPPHNPGSNTNLSSMPIGKHLGWVGKDIDYTDQQIQQIRNQTLRPQNHDSQDLGPQGAQEIFTAFANTHQENVLTMRRAYPTFFLTFTDEFRQGFAFLNNAYGWGAVREIKLIRSRKNPVDTLIVQLSNARGDLLAQQFNTLRPDDWKNSISFNRQVLKEGTDVKLQLGYHNDPSKLPVVFTGKITEIEGQNSAIVTIVCQSYAIELFQSEYGDSPVASMGWFSSDTKEIISSLLILPECQHLGRYQRGQIIQPGEGASSAAGTGWLPWRYFFSWLIPNPADNNVFVPDSNLLNTAWEGIKKAFRSPYWSVFKWLSYVPYRQLPWEIIDEMTLRHPGYIAYVVPYEGKGHHKATLFFGVPCQNYYWRAVDNLEAASLVPGTFLDPYQRQHREIKARRMRPFRNYFYVDSEHHLIDNGIITTARDTFNAVEVEYVLDAEKAFVNASDKSRPDPSAFHTNDAVKVKANDQIPDDYCRWFHTRERNCEGAVWARRYAVSYLYRHLKDLYTGEIVILGEPEIKPYDVVFIYDSYNDVCGPVEVEQVTHIFSPETGFVTSIIPDLCVQTNEYASASLIEAVQMYYGSLWLGLNSRRARFGSGSVNALDMADLPWTGIPSTETVKIKRSIPEHVLAAAGAGAPISALLYGGLPGISLSILLSFGGLVLFNWARQLNPIRITPVLWKGRPFICGLDGFTVDTAWGHAGNGLRRAFSGMGDFINQAKSTVQQLLGGGGF